MLKTLLTQIQAPETPPFWSVLIAVLFGFAYPVVYIAAGAFVVTVSGGDLASPSLNIAPLGVALACLINAFVVTRWVGRRTPDGNANQALRLAQTPTIPPLVLLLIGLGGAFLIDLLGRLTRLTAGQVVPNVYTVLGQLNTAGALVWAIAAATAVLIQPIGEELTYRGIVYPALTRPLGNLGALFVSSAGFALVHAAVLSTGGGVWYSVLQPFLMAIWVGGVRAYTQSTQAAIITRAAFGLFFVLSALFLR